MCEEYIDKPLYLLIADWMMAQNRWITAREISIEFDIEHSKAINTLSYILAEVGEIECETKMIPNKLAGRGCQCQRLVKVKNISPALYSRLRTSRLAKEVVCDNTPRLSVVPPGELNREQKWQWMLSKSMRR
ncbi:carnitine metabolism transcriptional regulator CaiF [Trabulsiella odontotermitis]|uniref:Transcriptional regulator n=1 Tax=Trabulsiella odontotermitis TaxID=379893 RepID=A0A0L0GZU3_9ENTR|nr:carnitine metabolism transcriptional regulator CaiF [Trabulsiella odontotermitis]KNC89338.1 transcriptional regulator [Trabulsiella odontotermitis]KNC94211.1 transcriptional regulator [Trabulsiella odontotermitis]